ncbi:hypothetical protein MPL3356_70130 [Mesorhizobium plurifarium]|uniref:Uncharacterized protein n=1 Tax=Mesorhizobium plurifarium TaxID=69974 RepID=A0A090EC37_MESPL|nr:hypothetical protein MPL3356_70130 [Mesorhizobium plurifarium]CDX37306.1 hypothetical protein MPLDJ20_200008 [Mesorhizobium plurifarium]
MAASWARSMSRTCSTSSFRSSASVNDSRETRAALPAMIHVKHYADVPGRVSRETSLALVLDRARWQGHVSGIL